MNQDKKTTSDGSLDVDKLTWAVLLGRWVEFARSALALPTDGEWRLLRESVSDIIMLQAVWFALQHLDSLEDDERALGVARAEVLIERHAAALGQRWRGEKMPDELVRLLTDARQALAEARN
ncbi:MAG: hypothetical protein Kow00105_04070 [Phycisphaeraceae bacterium]